MHTQNGSIKRHLNEAHTIRKTTRRELLSKTKILRPCSERRKLVMTEAILIKDKKPDLNSQEEGSDRLLQIFKHPLMNIYMYHVYEYIYLFKFYICSLLICTFYPISLKFENYF